MVGGQTDGVLCSRTGGEQKVRRATEIKESETVADSRLLRVLLLTDSMDLLLVIVLTGITMKCCNSPVVVAA